MISALKLAKTKVGIKQMILVQLSDCCFGVYIFQQFVLMLVERTELSKNLSPYISLGNFFNRIVYVINVDYIFKKN